jgi:hypothetical protein
MQAQTVAYARSAFSTYYGDMSYALEPPVLIEVKIEHGKQQYKPSSRVAKMAALAEEKVLGTAACLPPPAAPPTLFRPAPVLVRGTGGPSSYTP